jgi:hypothetical protein
MLAEQPRQIAALTSDLSPEQLRTSPDPGAWSVNDALAHLRSCSDVWGDCMRTIAAEEGATIRAINPRHWIKRTDYPDLEFASSFGAFCDQRAGLLAFLEPLSLGDWNREATVTGAGKPIVRTLYGFAWRLAVHERSHVKQIRRIAAAMRA